MIYKNRTDKGGDVLIHLNSMGDYILNERGIIVYGSTIESHRTTLYKIILRIMLL